ncbi:MAG TPA: heavy metal translocating P-type ATPase [Porphyromonadaceae bacterium]|jgi:Cd2+/Zn2+-exporting ATPase|uniref:heavy metal translocating P-type ATPase n=1 Tax=Limibacterium fermenti TaxID=3229863 RepID=UPI000E80EFCA|nr:heavy metal translocating P-type ATPase [Porphyromonadaceae bacterium]HBK32444.1 heavy metal translocating P-type ATPase [Porphyromonadaceae bacterium]HBL34476.1 heavy metal translocating P-type ATPase [Porphyromonadaceae bacterium]HBX46968.1 heavy metal translocating P-type ATPase [Porphyromonadaceae bacterium]
MTLPLQDKKFVFLLSAVVLSVTLEVLSLTGIDIPMPYAPFVYAALILGFGYEIILDGIKNLLRLNFSSISVLMLLAATGAYYLGEYPEAAVVIILYVLGEKLEDIGVDNSLSALENLVNSAPKTAMVKDVGVIPVEQIAVGTVIQVKPHDQIPLDGTIASGDTAVDESPITGEFVPKDKSKGDTVFAGTLNKNGFIEIITTRSAENTTFARIVAATYEAQNNRSESQKFIQKFAAIYTPMMVLLALLLFTVPVFVMGRDLHHWLSQAISLLVISCPCALVISTPVAIYAAMGNASLRGALVKGGKYLEALAGIKAVGLDKTRTLTYGKPVVSDVVQNHTDLEELLACAAGTEIFSEHPLAQAIVDYSRAQGFEPHKAEKFESIVGNGARSVCRSCRENAVLIGKPDFIEQHQAVPHSVKEETERFNREGKTCVVVSCGDEIRGVIALSDEMKPDSARAIAQLKDLGVQPVMMTGDNREAAQYVARQAGIDTVYAGLLPEDKSQTIARLQKEYGPTAMVGDGVNDAPALAASNVGIAMGAAGSDTAVEVADVALMNDNLSLLPYLIRLGRKTVSTIKRNTVAAIAVKIFFILLAFMGYSNLVLAIAADVGVMLVVVLLSLRLMNFK